jgi:hypothetical protein
MRLNPRQRAVHALFKTYIDVVHVGKEEGDKLFKQRTGVRVTRASVLHHVLPAIQYLQRINGELQVEGRAPITGPCTCFEV